MGACSTADTSITPQLSFRTAAHSDIQSGACTIRQVRSSLRHEADAPLVLAPKPGPPPC